MEEGRERLTKEKGGMGKLAEPFGGGRKIIQGAK